MEQLNQTLKFWTVQRKSVVEKVLNEGVFIPDFMQSPLVKENPDLYVLYNFILKCFNKNNGTDATGLVFTFMKMINHDIYFFKDILDFETGIVLNKDKIFALWNNFNKEDYVILELEITNPYNPILIEINNFQYLMPPFMEFMPPYKPGDDRIIMSWLVNGTIGQGYWPDSLAQAHLPYIRKEDIKGIYEFKTFKELEEEINL